MYKNDLRTEMVQLSVSELFSLNKHQKMVPFQFNAGPESTTVDQ